MEAAEEEAEEEADGEGRAAPAAGGAGRRSGGAAAGDAGGGAAGAKTSARGVSGDVCGALNLSKERREPTPLCIANFILYSVTRGKRMCWLRSGLTYRSEMAEHHALSHSPRRLGSISNEMTIDFLTSVIDCSAILNRTAFGAELESTGAISTTLRRSKCPRTAFFEVS